MISALPRSEEEPFDISALAEQLHDLRTMAQRRRYRGPTPKLPSRETIIAIVDDLVSALYPRHFGPQGLTAEALNEFVIRTLRSSLTALRAQARLELELDEEEDGERPDRNTRAIDSVRDFAQQLPSVRALADSDARAGFDGDPSATSIDEIVFSFPGFQAVLRHRLAHQLYKLGLPVLARIIGEDAHARTGIDIHPGAQIGERFFIDHGTGVVIGETAILGRNVRLYQAVTLGAKSFEIDASTGSLRKNYPRHPIVEDDVVIYAGATILGRVTIGKGASIGGNIWLTESVAPGTRLSQAKARKDAFSDGGGI